MPVAVGTAIAAAGALYKTMGKAKGVALKEGGITKEQINNATIGEAGPEAIIPLDQLPSLIADGFAPAVSALQSEISSLRSDMEGYFGSGGSAIKGIGKSTVGAFATQTL